MGLYTSDMKAYRALLAKKMEMAAWVELPMWNDFIGFIGNEDGRYPKSVSLGSSETKRLKPTGKPIEVLTNFMHEGSATMDIPVLNPLTEKPIYGDKQLLGTEETRKITYKTATINQVRKGVKLRDGRMSEQYLKKPEVQRDLMTGAQADLSDFFRRWNGYQPYAAFHQRYAEHITAPVIDGGLGYTAQSHPNFFVAGYTGTATGQVTFSNTKATYETNVSTALATLTDTTSDYFSTNTIEAAAFHASKLKIRRVKVSGVNEPVYCMVISPAQAVQLMRDSKWLTGQYYAAERGDQNRLFTGILIGVYRGVAIFVDQNNPGCKISGDTDYDAARGTVNYGNSNPYSDPIDASPRKLAILFGASAVVAGYASPLGFEQEVWDYKNKKTEGGQMIVGFERADIYDTDGYYGTAGNFKENTSSLVIATYSSENVSV